MSDFRLSFAVTPEDDALLARVGVSPARGGIHEWTFARLNEVVSLLDREAERGDKAAADLAAYFLLAGEDVYYDAKREAQWASL
jgi:hypothetical protein